MKKLVAVITALAAIIMLASPAFANSAEPPTISVIVYDAPYDLDVKLRLENGEVEITPMKRNNQDYVFKFYGANSKYEAILVTTGGESFEVACSENDYGYHAVVVLNLDDRTLTAGEPAIREVPLVALRFALTLIIEGGIFFLFGYRQKRSWIIFAVTNIFTQCVMNFAFLGLNLGYMWVLVFFIWEFLIWLSETTVYVWSLREKNPIIAAAYALTANLASLIIGGILIGMLQFAYVS